MKTTSDTIQFNKVQIYMALAAQSVIILSAALGLALWVGRVLVQNEFQTQLEIFHAHAVPEIEKMMDAKITMLAKEREQAIAENSVSISGRLATLEEHARNTDAQLDRIEGKLDRVLR